MRVPYAPHDPPDASSAPVYERIAARRHPRPLLSLDLALLHNPDVADGWNSFIGAIRSKTSLPTGLKELAISRIAVLNKATHEWDIHAALAVKEGISHATMQELLDLPVTPRGDVSFISKSNVQNLGLEEQEMAVLAYADQMTIGVAVEDHVADNLQRFFNAKQIVELTATVAAYNCVSRFLVALDVGEGNDAEMKAVRDL